MHSILAFIVAAFQFIIELIVAAFTHFGAWLFFGAIFLLIFLPYIAPATPKPEKAEGGDSGDKNKDSDKDDKSEKKWQRLFYMSMLSNHLKHQKTPPPHHPVQINIVAAPGSITADGSTPAADQMKVITQVAAAATPPENPKPVKPRPRRAAKIKV